MKTDTVNTEKWKIDKTGINLFIDEGDWQVCEIGKDNDTNRGNAELIMQAVNACKEINPDNPLNVAKALPEILENLQNMIWNFEGKDGLSHVQKKAIEYAKAAIKKVDE